MVSVSGVLFDTAIFALFIVNQMSVRYVYVNAHTLQKKKKTPKPSQIDMYYIDLYNNIILINN